MSTGSHSYGALEMGESSPLIKPPPLSARRKREIAMRREAKQTSVMGSILGNVKENLRHVEASKANPTATSGSSPSQQPSSHHSWLYTLLNPHSKKPQALLFKRIISFVILADLIIFIVSTDKRLSSQYPTFFHAAEGVSSCIFLLEYICRLVTITESHRYRDKGPLHGRIAYACSKPAIIDFLSTAPFFLELATGWNLPTLTFLRLFRLLRILKTEGYVRAVDAIYRVIYYNSEILYVAALLCIFLILVTAVLLYYLQPADEEDAEAFGSIAATLYMSTMMLTGQGGPEGDLPWYTKLVVLLTSVFSVAMFAIPASMLTWGFEAEAERMAKRARRRALKKIDGANSSDDTASDDENTTDDEYFRIIAGEDEEDADASNDTPWMKDMRRKFLEADSNMDGTLTLHEFFELQASIVEAPPPPAALVNASTISRMRALERKVAANAEKLDLVLEALRANNNKED